MDILRRNYYRMLRNGAFGHDEPLEPMSRYKWNKVAKMAESDNVAHHMATMTGAMPRTAAMPHAEGPNYRGWLLQRITSRERHSMDCSVATLELLNIIMHNIGQTVGRHTSLRTIIDMGLFLRTQGDKVDYIKLERWLSSLRVRRMAELHASMLVAVMGFHMSELPFVRRYDPWAQRLIAVDRRLTAAYLLRYPLTTIDSWIKTLWRVVTQIEE